MKGVCVGIMVRRSWGCVSVCLHVFKSNAYIESDSCGSGRQFHCLCQPVDLEIHMSDALGVEPFLRFVPQSRWPATVWQFLGFS